MRSHSKTSADSCAHTPAGACESRSLANWRQKCSRYQTQRAWPEGRACYPDASRVSTALPALSRATASTRYIRWTTVVLCLVAAVLIFGGFSFYSRFTTRGSDVNEFYHGGRLIADRPGELYEQIAPRRR